MWSLALDSRHTGLFRDSHFVGHVHDEVIVFVVEALLRSTRVVYYVMTRSLATDLLSDRGPAASTCDGSAVQDD